MLYKKTGKEVGVTGKADFKKAEATALGLLRDFGVTKPPINPVEIAARLDVKVWFVEFAGEYSKVSGFYDVDEQAIYVNKDEYPHRQTFTVAHELGHHLLHKEWAQSGDYKMLFRDEKGSKDAHEQEANAFAANLLVPRSMLMEYKNLANVSDLATLFLVSAPVIENRLNLCAR